MIWFLAIGSCLIFGVCDLGFVEKRVSNYLEFLSPDGTQSV